MRLDIERQKQLEPKRMAHAVEMLESMGFKVEVLNESELNFDLRGNKIKFFPYSGWAQGKGIKACRGLQNLLRQL